MIEKFKKLENGNLQYEVTVEDPSTVTGIALLAPAILAQVLIFLVSLYFYLATRENIRISTLSLCISRRMRWRTSEAHEGGSVGDITFSISSPYDSPATKGDHTEE